MNTHIFAHIAQLTVLITSLCQIYRVYAVVVNVCMYNMYTCVVYLNVVSEHFKTALNVLGGPLVYEF